MVKKLVLRDSYEDNFSLKKLVKKIGTAHKDMTIVLNTPMTTIGKAVGIKKEAPKASTKLARGAASVVGDAQKLGIQPIESSINSVTNKKSKITFDTKVGKIAGKVQGAGVDGLHTVGKTFADTISGGAVSKVKDWAFKSVDPKNKTGYVKQAGGKYTEMRKDNRQDSGVKELDKVLGYIPVASAIVGTAAAAYVGGSAASGDKDKSNIKPSNVVVGPNVLDEQQPIVTDSPMQPNENGLYNNLPAGVQPGDVPGYAQNSNIKTASGLSMGFDFKNPFVIGGIILAVILLIVAAKHRQG